MDKGVDEDDIYIDVDAEDDYISVSVQVSEKQETKEEVEIKEFKKMRVMIRDMDEAKERHRRFNQTKFRCFSKQHY